MELSKIPKRFKFYNPKKKSVSPVFTLGQLIDAIKRLDFNIDDEQWIMVQSLGVQDRNLVEIFEGDICKQMVNGHEVIGVMEFRQKQLLFGLSAFTKFEDIPSEVSIKLKEQNEAPQVIGNVFQNPELLPTEKLTTTV